jgi:pimeloyl-ACP methyl ester carboxylesterase
LLFSIANMPAVADDKVNKIETREISTTHGTYIEDVYHIGDTDPVGLHLLRKKGKYPEEIIMMLPGTGLGFRTNFLTPENQNLAMFYADNGYMVAGIDYRETLIDYEPSETYNNMEKWGIDQHIKDMKKMIKFSQKTTDIDEYSLVGHSLGGILSLAYTSKYHGDEDIQSIVVLEAGQFNPETETDMVERAEETYYSVLQAMDDGNYVELEMLGFAKIILNAKQDPDGDSGIQKSSDENFTNEEFVLFTLINTNLLPGNWQFNQGFCSGDMIEGLYYSPIDVIYEAGLNGTIYPMAIERDLYAWMGSVSKGYTIEYDTILVPIVWINTEGGMGERGGYTAQKIRDEGNEEVEFVLIDGGHIDIIYGNQEDYAYDIWERYLS